MDWICQIDPWKAMTTITAVFAGWIAWNQYHVNNEKLRLDLFEKRYAVYKATQALLTKVMVNASAKDEDIIEFRIEKGQAVFLFDEKLTDYLKEIDSHALNLLQYRAELEGLSKGEKRNAKVKQKMAEIKWLDDQLPLLAGWFAPYLKFKAK